MKPEVPWWKSTTHHLVYRRHKAVCLYCEKKEPDEKEDCPSLLRLNRVYQTAPE